MLIWKLNPSFSFQESWAYFVWISGALRVISGGNQVFPLLLPAQSDLGQSPPPPPKNEVKTRLFFASFLFTLSHPNLIAKGLPRRPLFGHWNVPKIVPKRLLRCFFWEAVIFRKHYVSQWKIKKIAPTMGPISAQDRSKTICRSFWNASASLNNLGMHFVSFLAQSWSFFGCQNGVKKRTQERAINRGLPPKTVNSSKAAPRRSKAPQIRPKRRPSLSKRPPQRRPSLSKSFQKCFEMKPNDSQAHVQRSQERFIITRRQHYNEAAPKSFTLRVSARSRRLNNGRCQYSIQKASQKTCREGVHQVYRKCTKVIQNMSRKYEENKTKETTWASKTKSQ